MKKNSFISLFLKGTAIGIANMIAGISGGTIAFIVGVYEDMIDALANLTKKFWPNFLYLLKIALGIGFGIILCAKVLNILFDILLLETISFFAGVIFGGCINDIPALKFEASDNKKKCWISFIIAFLVVVGFSFLNLIIAKGKYSPSDRFTNVNFGTMCLLFVFIIFGAIAMIFPGISGSMVLMLLGAYYPVLNAISDLMHFSNYSTPGFLWNEFKIIFPLVLGAVLSLIFISKPIKWLFQKYRKLCLYIIMGFVLGSVIGIYVINFHEVSLTFTTWHLIFSLLFTAPFGFFLSIILHKLSLKKEAENLWKEQKGNGQISA